MKGFFGACLIGMSTAFIHSQSHNEWVLTLGAVFLLIGLDLVIEDRIESATEKLTRSMDDKIEEAVASSGGDDFDVFN